MEVMLNVTLHSIQWLLLFFFALFLCLLSSPVCSLAFLLSNWCRFLLLNHEPVHLTGENKLHRNALEFTGRDGEVLLRFGGLDLTGIVLFCLFFFPCTANVEKIFVFIKLLWTEIYEAKTSTTFNYYFFLSKILKKNWMVAYWVYRTIAANLGLLHT